MTERIITAFNSQFKEFLRTLCATFPEDKDFSAAKTSVNMLIALDEKQPIKLFCQYIPAYEERIEARDEQFFLENSYSEIATEHNVTSELVDKLPKGQFIFCK